MENRKIISDREQKEWYAGCPLLITRNTITQGENSNLYSVSMVICTEKSIGKIEITTAFSDARRVPIENISYTICMEKASDLPCPENAVYAHTTIDAVYTDDDVLLWERKEKSPLRLPEQEILWQTDPLYSQLRRECEGIVNPVYRPDTFPGGWRCTCGHINLDTRKLCGTCHADHNWLISHFDPDFLRERQAEFEALQAAAPDKKKVNYRNEKVLADQRRMTIIYGCLASVLVFVILLFTLIIPSIKYSNADKALDTEDYDTAITVFTKLGTFRDADERAKEAVYKKAQSMTGLTTVNMVTSEECPWFSITEDGVLSFRKEKYTGTWDHFVVPDLVDGVIVRELEKNFFLNCKDMVSVTLSGCIEVLGEQVFFNCESMTTVHFGSGLKTIGPRAFINCYSLAQITVPDSVVRIGIRAFNSCVNLKKVTLGTGITELPNYLFSCCYSLEEVILRAPITKISAYAFSECLSMKSISFAGAQQEWDSVVIEQEDNDILEKVSVIVTNP